MILLLLSLFIAPVKGLETDVFYDKEYAIQKECDIDLLSRLITAECGAEWCSDEMCYYTGSVVINRVKHSDFPDTIESVIYQESQYSVVTSGSINNNATERCKLIANELISKGSVLPDDVVFQANFQQGSGLYKQVQNMYFCYR